MEIAKQKVLQKILGTETILDGDLDMLEKSLTLAAYSQEFYSWIKLDKYLFLKQMFTYDKDLTNKFQ